MYKPLYAKTSEVEPEKESHTVNTGTKYKPLYAGKESEIDTTSRINPIEEPKSRVSVSSTIDKIAKIIDKPMSIISKPFEVVLEAGSNATKGIAGGLTDIVKAVPETVKTYKDMMSSGKQITDEVVQPIMNTYKDMIKSGVEPINIYRDMIKSGKQITDPYTKPVVEGYKKMVKPVTDTYKDMFLETGKLIEKMDKGYTPTTDELFENLDTKEKVKAFTQEFGKATSSLFKATGQGELSTISGSLGYLERFGWDGAKTSGEKVNEWILAIANEDPTALDVIGSAIGSMAAFYLPSMGIAKGTSVLYGISPKLANLVGNSAMTILESMSEAGSVYKDLIAQGKSPEEAAKKADIDFGINIVLLKLTDKFDFVGDGKNTLIQEMKSRLLAGFREESQETGQQVSSNIATGKQWNEGLKESALVGWLMGFLLGGSPNTNINMNVQTQEEIKDIVEKAEKDGSIITEKTKTDSIKTKVETQILEITKETDLSIDNLITKPNIVNNARDILEELKTVDKIQGIESSDIFMQTEIFNSFNDKNSSVDLEVKGIDGSVLAEIKTVQYPDKKWGYSYNLKTSVNGTSSDFITNELQTSKENAIEKAKKDLAGYVLKDINNVPENIQTEYSKIIDQLSEPTKKIETEVKVEMVDGVYPTESVIGELKDGDKVKVGDKIYTYKKVMDVTGDIQEILDTGSMTENDLTINRSKGKVSIETIFQGDEPLYVFDSNTEAKTTETKTETKDNRMFKTSKEELDFINKSNGKIDSERLYLLKQEAELYPTIEEFIKSTNFNDLTESEVKKIWEFSKPKVETNNSNLKTELSDEDKAKIKKLNDEYNKKVDEFNAGKISREEIDKLDVQNMLDQEDILEPYRLDIKIKESLDKSFDEFTKDYYQILSEEARDRIDKLAGIKDSPKTLRYNAALKDEVLYKNREEYDKAFDIWKINFEKDLKTFWEKNNQTKTEEKIYTGKQIRKEAKELGSDQGGLSDFTLDNIEKENYKFEDIEISELRKLDESLDEYLTNETEVREFEGEPFGMDPIVSSSGEVIDGWNRINQAIHDGETTISVLRGIGEKKSVLGELDPEMDEYITKIFDEQTPEPKTETEVKKPRFVKELTLEEEAKKYKTADEFINAQPIAYHGTNQTFDNFEIKGNVKNTGSISADEAIFFTNNKLEAGTYARLANKKISSEEKLLQSETKRLQEEMDIAKRTGNWELYENKITELEDLEENLLRSDKEVNNIMERRIDTTSFKVVDMKDRPQFDLSLTKELKQAKKENYNGIVFENITDSASYDVELPESTTHYAVFNVDNIKTEKQLTDIWNEANKTEQISTKSKELSEILKEQIGDIFDIVEPAGNLWIPKGNTIFISLKKDRSGFSKWLGEKNFVNSVAEAGNNVYRVEMKEPQTEVKKPTTRFTPKKPTTKKPTTKAKVKDVTGTKVAKIMIGNARESKNLPIIQNFLVENGKLYATNLESAIEINTNLGDGVYKFFGKEFVKTEFTKDDFPMNLKVQADPVVEIKTSVLKPALDKANIALKGKSSSIREEINGIYLESDGKELKMIATDSYRLFLERINNVALKEGKVLIQESSKLARVIDYLGDDIKISYDEDRVSFSGENGEMIIKIKTKGDYPDIKMIYPEMKNQYSFDKKEFVEVLNTFKPMTDETNKVGVSFDGKDVKIILDNTREGIHKEKTIKATKKTINVESRELTDGYLLMPIREDSDVADTFFDVDYLLGATKTTDGETMYWNLPENIDNQPVLFSEKSNISNKKENRFAKTSGTQGLYEKQMPRVDEDGYLPFANKWETTMSLEPKTTKTINKTDIMNWVEKEFNVPIKSKVTHKWKAAGVYYPSKWLIRLKKWGELPVLTHELAHHIDNSYAKTLGKGWYLESKVIRQELRDLDYDQRKRRTDEGFAEYMRYKLTTDQAQSKAPEFTKFFNNFLKENPRLETNLNELKDKVDTWLYQGAENRVINHIDWKGEHTKTKGFGNKKEKAVKFLQEKFNDEFYSVNKITREIEKTLGRNLRPSQNPAKMLEYSKSKAGAIARTFVMKNTIDESGLETGKGLKDILEPVSKKDIKTFIAYAASKRALVLEKRGIESGFDIDDAQYILNKYKDKGWDGIVKELNVWSDSLMDWVIRAGGLDENTAKHIRDLNPVYIPFKRAFLDEAQVIQTGKSGFVNTSTGIKKIKGSGRPIINPIESMIAQATELIAKAQKLRIASILVDLSTEEGLGGYITKVPAPMEATTFNASQISGYIESITGEKSENISDDLLTVFSQGSRFTGKENVVTVFKNGKPQFYEIHQDLYNALEGIDPLKLGPVSKMLAPAARLLRLGATGLKVAFGVARNPFRDALSYVVFSIRKAATIFDPLKGMYISLTAKKGTPTSRFKNVGGELSGQIGLDRASTKNAFDEILQKNLGLKGKALYVVLHPISALRDILSVTEMGPRSIEMEENYKMYTSEKWKNNHPDWTEEDAFIQAFNDAQDVTVNFTKSGKWAKQLNQITAFFNVGIRGPEKLVRTFKERPVTSTIKALSWLTSLALLSWWKNKDKDWYKSLDLTYKYSNVFFEIGGNVYRLPIPFELGTVFMAMPQALLDTYNNKDTDSIKAVLKILESQIPDPTPSAFGPLLDIASNKNYLGNPIESKGMSYKYVTERYQDWTTNFAKSLSKVLDKVGIEASPIKLDYLIDSYTGGVLKQFNTDGNVYNLPILSDLMLRDPNYPRRQLNDFFEDYTELQLKINSENDNQKENNKFFEIATKEEVQKFNTIKTFYNIYKDVQPDIITIKAEENEEKLNKMYEYLRKQLTAYGYD